MSDKELRIPLDSTTRIRVTCLNNKVQFINKPCGYVFEIPLVNLNPKSLTQCPLCTERYETRHTTAQSGDLDLFKMIAEAIQIIHSAKARFRIELIAPAPEQEASKDKS
jgi:hypothetical protein